jgi:hypothetical protein
MQNEAEAQAPVDAERHAGRIGDVVGQVIELICEKGRCVLA